MIKSSISLRDLRRKIYLKAKAEKRWRFWGLYVHISKMETLQEAYRMAKRNNGAPRLGDARCSLLWHIAVESPNEEVP